MKTKLRYSAILLLLSLILSGLGTSCNRNNTQAKYTSIRPGELWLDTDGEHINAHGGGILYHEGLYYWFGEHKTEGRRGNSSQVGVSCYSSKDLMNWTNEGIALKVDTLPGSEIIKGCVIERPKVIFNKKTNTFVMWFHLELKGQGYNAAKTGLAVSDKITGPFTFLRSENPNKNDWPIDYPEDLKTQNFPDNFQWWTPEFRDNVNKGIFIHRDFKKGQMSRDMTLFVDDDGKAYHIHSSEENLTLHISELSDDYLSFSGKWKRIFPAGHNEAPAIFKHNSKYYMMTSGCTGWAPNAARIAVADSIFGEWTFLGNPCVGENADKTFDSQSTFILPLEGVKNAYIYMGDRWRPKNPIDGRYIWLPFYLDSDVPQLKWMDEWNFDLFNTKKNIK